MMCICINVISVICMFMLLGFADVGEMINKKLPHVKIILPTANTIPVTLNGGITHILRYFISNVFHYICMYVV